MTLKAPFQESVLLKKYCTFGIGGPARYFLEVKTVDEMQQALAFCSKSQLAFIVIGKGSNCLFDDQGFNGLVVLNKIDFIDEISSGTFHVGAGYSFSLLGSQTARQGWSGLEFAAGIPGSVGGAVFMNAGANGVETCQALQSVDFVSADGSLHHFKNEDLTYAYRVSPFQQMKGAIVGATFHLKREPQAREYQVGLVRARSKSQPYSSMSAGCIFVNPPGQHAGALIEKCGLKGFSIGDAQVSPVHANFLVNTGEASCEDMQQLITAVRRRVKDQYDVELKSEVRRIPYEWEDK